MVLSRHDFDPDDLLFLQDRKDAIENLPWLTDSFACRVCQLPKRTGNPRHLHPCSATYRIVLRDWRHIAALG